MNEADLILMLIDARGMTEKDDLVLDKLKEYKAPKILGINKVDLVSKNIILPLIEETSQTGYFKEIIPISALKYDGLNHLQSLLIDNLPAGEPFYPPDMISDEPERFFVSEIIREKIFMLYGEEVPYATTVKIERFEERQRRKDYINATIYVERDSQKGIIIGKGGSALKRVGQSARESIEQFLDRPVFLELNVKVQKKWRKNAALMKRLGYS
jgi:GTP-binding protein Era